MHLCNMPKASARLPKLYRLLLSSLREPQTLGSQNAIFGKTLQDSQIIIIINYYY